MNPSSLILVTGGAGYIGSHTVLALLQARFQVCVLDNFSNSSAESLRRIEKIVGYAPELVHGDVRDGTLLRKLFSKRRFHAVLHFAGLKSIGESVQHPLSYFDNNTTGTIQLCKAMVDAEVYRLIFSSSATVYGEPAQIPISETCPISNPTNPYGRSKLMVEEILQDLAKSDSRWRIALLRYFNPVGAHESGLIGEHPDGTPNNLLPYLTQVAVGKLSALRVFGNDYPTPDGTGVRDYVHVQDLADGHIKALGAIEKKVGIDIWNLGTGQGYSVLEIVRAFEKASGKIIPFNFVPRRKGDIAECWADPTKAFEELNWKAKRGLTEMMSDAWRWQSNNPNGYKNNILGV